MSLPGDLGTFSLNRLDLSDYAQASLGESVESVLATMRRHRVSAVLVRRPDGSLAGIFTERDVLLRIVDQPATWGRPVDEFMTPDPHVLTPEAPVSRALELMNAGHYRNVPVVTADGRVVGNLSQHALIRCLTDRFPRQTYNLPPEALRVARTREGA